MLISISICDLYPAIIAQLKHVEANFNNPTVPPSSKPSPAAAAAASYTMGGGSVPPPPPPKESFARRYKYVWPLLLTVNLAVGGNLAFSLVLNFVCLVPKSQLG